MLAVAERVDMRDRLAEQEPPPRLYCAVAWILAAGMVLPMLGVMLWLVAMAVRLLLR